MPFHLAKKKVVLNLLKNMSSLYLMIENPLFYGFPGLELAKFKKNEIFSG